MKENLIRDGQTQPVFSYKETILERVYVETPVDTDDDGKLDLMAVYIRRPKETLQGLKIPAVYVANPYMMHCNEDWYVPHDVNEEIREFEQQHISREAVKAKPYEPVGIKPEFLRESRGFATEPVQVEQPDFEAVCDMYSYFVCRGYALVLCGGLGTQGSEGLTLTGSREEILAFRSVIDWMCGRARAFTNKTDNIEVKADWCTGKVAMTGKSYLGTMCIGVGVTGVEGLETIIPEAAISNWYQYYRNNGLTVPALDWQGDDLDILAKYCCSRALDESDYPAVKDIFEKKHRELLAGQDRDSGNYNRFWDERNYLNQISSMKASALIIHGINDWNVKMNQCVPFFDGLKKLGIPVKMLLHQGDHIYIYNMKHSPALDLVHRWLDYHLYGLENGVVEETADVWVQSSRTEEWLFSEEFPPEHTQYISFPAEANTLVTGGADHAADSLGKGAAIPETCFCDDLAAAGYDRKRDNQKEWQDNLVLPEAEGRSYCLKYLWDPFGENSPGNGKDSIRISGEVAVKLSASADRGTAVLSAMLVEYGEEKRLTVKKAPAGEKRSWGPDTPEYEVEEFLYEEQPSAYRVISRGHMNIQNRENLWSKCHVEPGTAYEYEFHMVPTDYTLQKGKRLGLIIYGSDAMQTLRPSAVTKITVEKEQISVLIPFLQDNAGN